MNNSANERQLENRIEQWEVQRKQKHEHKTNNQIISFII